jgi:hypothetical protein
VYHASTTGVAHHACAVVHEFIAGFLPKVDVEFDPKATPGSATRLALNTTIGLLHVCQGARACMRRFCRLDLFCTSVTAIGGRGGARARA